MLLILLVASALALEGSHQPSVHTLVTTTKVAATAPAESSCSRFSDELLRLLGQPQGRTKSIERG